MLFGLYLRNMGPQATRRMLRECAQAADASGIDEIWVADHVAIPREESQGSGGRYLDPLATLAFLAAATDRVRIGSGVLVLPYRPPLITAKLVATIQELSGNRLMLGVGSGWMPAEFRALGIDRRRRSTLTDETLSFLRRCFDADEVEVNGQKFLFLPRPPRPPIFVGGAPPHALQRAVRFGEGWMPVGVDRSALEPAIAEMRAIADKAGKPRPEVVYLGGLPLEDPARGIDQAHALAEIGVTRLVHAFRYQSAEEFRRAADVLADRIKPHV